MSCSIKNFSFGKRTFFKRKTGPKSSKKVLRRKSRKTTRKTTRKTKRKFGAPVRQNFIGRRKSRKTRKSRKNRRKSIKTGRMSLNAYKRRSMRRFGRMTSLSQNMGNFRPGGEMSTNQGYTGMGVPQTQAHLEGISPDLRANFYSNL